MNKKVVKKQIKKQSPKKVVKKIPKKRVKLRYKNILILILFIIILLLFISYLIKLPIKNIYIKGNTILKDQTIIELANLENYPASLENSESKIQRKLEKNPYIKEVKVSKKWITEVHITITENRPLFYDVSKNKLVLEDKKETDDKLSVPYLINYIPDTIYDTFISSFKGINNDVLIRISEIQYKPNEVDTSRFFLAMNDGNYVYLTLNKFSSINSYIDIVRNFKGKKGILYLDSGEYFEILAD